MMEGLEYLLSKLVVEFRSGCNPIYHQMCVDVLLFVNRDKRMARLKRQQDAARKIQRFIRRYTNR